MASILRLTESIDYRVTEAGDSRILEQESNPYDVSSYSITIGGVDYTSAIKAKSPKINDASNSSPSTCSLTWANNGLSLPSCGDEIVITVNDERLFGGYITEITPDYKAGTVFEAKLSCVDYTRTLDRRLVVEGYESMTDLEIIQDIIDRYASDEGFTTTNVIEGVTISQLTFNYVQPSQAIGKIAKLTNRAWYVDYNKDIHYFPLTETPTELDITEDTSHYYDLKLKKSNIGIKNRIFVRGGTELSDPVTISFAADGQQTIFNLPEKPHDLTMTVGGVSKTVGIQNVDDAVDYDYLLNFQEKYIAIGNDSTPTAGTVMEFTYKYEIPILIAQENTASITTHGVYEHAIFDNSIKTSAAARDRAIAELTDFASTFIDGSFKTLSNTYRAGQYITVTLPDIDIDDSYLIQSVQAQSMGAGMYEYSVKIASAQKVGMVKFLIGLLEQNKNLLNITSDETVDEIYRVTADTVTPTDDTYNETVVDVTTDPALWDGNSDWNFFQWG